MPNDKEWAIKAARRLRVEFADASAIETANYALCSFILAAAELALEDEEFARKLAERMDSPREASAIS